MEFSQGSGQITRPHGQIPLQLTDTIVNKESLQRLRLAAAAGRAHQEVE